MSEDIRVGVLGAAWIVPSALIKPVREVGGIRVESIAARDPARAAAFARKHSIPRVHESYDQLLADPAIDAVYLPLPNSLHCHWAIRALESGKHVLCEKPLASNAEECEQLAEATRRSGKALAEAMHFRYHPLAGRLAEIARSKPLGPVKRIEVRSCFPIFRGSDIRYQLKLGGGAAMDLGCYAVSLCRLLGNEEPTVVACEARLASPEIDRWMAAELTFPSGATARVLCSIWSRDFLHGDAKIEGRDGTLEIANPFAPQLFHALNWSTGGSKKKEQLQGTRATLYYQLQAFVEAINGGQPMLTGPDEAASNMRVIDAMYRKANLQPRGLAEGTIRK